MIWSVPLMLVSLFVTTGLLLWYFRKDLAKFDVSLQERLARGLSIAPVVKVPYMRGLILIVLTVLAIASHHQTEELLGLDKNSVLLVMPLICAGIVMILKPDRARYYVEKEVDWWTLIFFMLLFAVAGTLEHTHVDQVLADGFSKIAGKDITTLVPFIFTVSSFGSAFVDNVIFVAAFSPVIEQLGVTIKDLPLWWALLFGACFGGNITMIGSTANIVALGMLEKHGGSQITFFQWFKIGLLCTVVSGLIAIFALLFMAPMMPDHKITFDKLAANSGYVPGVEEFSGELIGSLVKEDNTVYLVGRLNNKDEKGNVKEAKIRVELPANIQFVEGKVRVSGMLSADKANAEYPYMMKVKKLDSLNKD